MTDKNSTNKEVSVSIRLMDKTMGIYTLGFDRDGNPAVFDNDIQVPEWEAALVFGTIIAVTGTSDLCEWIREHRWFEVAKHRASYFPTREEEADYANPDPAFLDRMIFEIPGA